MLLQCAVGATAASSGLRRNIETYALFPLKCAGWTRAHSLPSSARKHAGRTDSFSEPPYLAGSPASTRAVGGRGRTQESNGAGVASSAVHVQVRQLHPVPAGAGGRPPGGARHLRVLPRGLAVQVRRPSLPSLTASIRSQPASTCPERRRQRRSPGDVAPMSSLREHRRGQRAQLGSSHTILLSWNRTWMHARSHVL